MPGFKRTLDGLTTMASHLDTVREKAGATAPAVRAAREAAVTEAKEQFDVLSDLYARSKEVQNDFSKDFELDIQRVRLGAITLEEYTRKWGDAKIATANGFETIREAFSGADFGQYRQQIQDFIGDITSGAADVGEIVDFLKKNVGDLAKGLINALELFKAGKISLEDFQRVIDATKAAFPGTDSDALAEAIRNAALGGQL